MFGSLNQRQLLLTAALVLTLLAAIFAPPKPEEELVQPKKVRSVTIVDSKNKNIAIPVENTEQWVKERVWNTKKGQNLFPSKIKSLPPPIVVTPQVPVPPPKPIAPPLPFVYIGKVIEEGKLIVFVAKQQQNYLLKGGELIEGTYRVDKVESGQIVFNYLPLETEQVMTFGVKD